MQIYNRQALLSSVWRLICVKQQGKYRQKVLRNIEIYTLQSKSSKINNPEGTF